MDADGEHSVANLENSLLCNKHNPDLVVENDLENRVLEKILSYLFKLRFEISDPLWI